MTSHALDLFSDTITSMDELTPDKFIRISSSASGFFPYKIGLNNEGSLLLYINSGTIVTTKNDCAGKTIGLCMGRINFTVQSA